jgi:hypothetical protein
MTDDAYQQHETFMQDFYAGKIEPREGDFIGSEIAPRTCGFHTGVVKLAGRKGNPIKSYEIRLASGDTTFVLANDLRMVAPREWE